MIKYVNFLLGGILVGVGIGGWWSWNVAADRASSIRQEAEQASLCHDDEKREAWIARKNGISRCFLEYREFPHRSKGHHLEENNNAP